MTTGQATRHEQALASDGANRVAVAWRDENGDLRGRLFDETGTPVTPERVWCTAGGSVERPRVAWDGAQFVAFITSPGAKEVQLVRLTADAASVPCGARLTTIVAPSWEYYDLDVAAGGGTALVLITHYLEAIRERGGVAVDATPLQLATDGEGGSAAWSGADFLVVWHQPRRWSHDVVGTRLPAMGPPTDVPHPIATGDWTFPDIAFDGKRALVVWSDGRNGRPDVFGSFVDQLFAPAGPQSFPFAAGSQEEESARVAAVSPGRFVVAITRFDATPGVFARRVALRWVTDLAQAAGCSRDEECQSGFCVDGVCCDSACGGGQGDCDACTQALGASADGVWTVLAAQTQCRGAASDCDVAELCDGTGRSCPGDQAKPDGLACSGGTGVCGVGQCRTGSAPRFTSAVSVLLTCGQTWSYSKAGRPEVAGDGPFTFSARTADGAPLPDSFTIDPATGELSWRTTRAQAGTVTIELRVESPAGFDTQVVELVVDCSRRQAAVACAESPGVLLLAALALAWRRRSRRCSAGAWQAAEKGRRLSPSPLGGEGRGEGWRDLLPR